MSAAAYAKPHPSPVLFLTARDGEVDRILGLELSIRDHGEGIPN
jgi:DNA-binding response OmpR family regulator